MGKSPKEKSENSKSSEEQNRTVPVPVDQNLKKRKVDAIHILSGKTYTLPVLVNGQSILATLDTGATVSAIASNCVPNSKFSRAEAIPLQVGNGEYI